MDRLPPQFLDTSEVHTPDPTLSYPGSTPLQARAMRSVTPARPFILARTYPTAASVNPDMELDVIVNLPEYRRFKGRAWMSRAFAPMFDQALPQPVPQPRSRMRPPRRLTKILPATEAILSTPMYGQPDSSSPAPTRKLRRRWFN